MAGKAKPADDSPKPLSGPHVEYSHSEVEQKPKAKYGPLSAILVTLAVYFGSQILAGLAFGLFLALTDQSIEEAFDRISESTFGQFLFILFVEIFTLALIYAFVKRRKITPADIGLGRLPKLSDAGYSLIWFAMYFVSLAIIMAAVGVVAPEINLDQEQQIGFESATGPLALAFVFISLVILPPIVEEIMIRGFLYSGLRAKLSRITSALVASILFGIAHLQLGSGAPPLYVAAIDTFILSMFLISLREKTGSLWAGMFVHGIKNGLAFVVLFVLGTS